MSDPFATRFHPTSRKLDWLVRHHWKDMTPYEKAFCKNVYSMERRTPRQHVFAGRLYKRYNRMSSDVKNNQLRMLVDYVERRGNKIGS